jgi:hypothetical protein
VNREPAKSTSALALPATVYAVAVAANYPWEIAQSSLYEGMDGFGAMWWHCLVASLGDGLLVLLIFAAGWAVFGRARWFTAPGVRGYGLMLAAGFAIAVAVEWVALHVLRRWTYTARMPLVPGLGVGLVPVMQMLILPPLVFWIAGGISKRIPQGDTR